MQPKVDPRNKISDADRPLVEAKREYTSAKMMLDAMNAKDKDGNLAIKSEKMRSKAERRMEEAKAKVESLGGKVD